MLFRFFGASALALSSHNNNMSSAIGAQRGRQNRGMMSRLRTVSGLFKIKSPGTKRLSHNSTMSLVFMPEWLQYSSNRLYPCRHDAINSSKRASWSFATVNSCTKYNFSGSAGSSECCKQACNMSWRILNSFNNACTANSTSSSTTRTVFPTFRAPSDSRIMDRLTQDNKGPKSVSSCTPRGDSLRTSTTSSSSLSLRTEQRWV
mmetsp:Transcript_92842/g.262177  ORF Transcript_92842/g.262177 Transcript_92842/m.262177 type:complete len:204 (+) Transcript_92842:292-903(+)